MAILKFEIDTDEIYNDYDDNVSFEDLVRGALGRKVREKITDELSDKKIESAAKVIALESIHQVEKKISNLINEDLVIPDRWGKPTFVGSVEDYIKKQIDEKMLSPVDNKGKKLSNSCSRDEKTWIEWSVEKGISNALSHIKREAESQANDFCRKELDKKLEEFKSSALTKIITDKLNAVGIK